MKSLQDLIFQDINTLSETKEIEMGKKVEAEHTGNPDVATKIARDHLAEDPHYYAKLKKAGLADELKTESFINELTNAPLIGKAKTIYNDKVHTVKPEDLSGIVGEFPADNPISHTVLGKNKEGNVDVKFSMPSGKTALPSGREAVNRGVQKRGSFLDTHFEDRPGLVDGLIGLAKDVKANSGKAITLPDSVASTKTDIGKLKAGALAKSGHSLQPSELSNIASKHLDNKLETLVRRHNSAVPLEGNPESPHFKELKNRLQTVAGRFGNVASGMKALTTNPDSFITSKGGINTVTSDPMKGARTKTEKAQDTMASLINTAQTKAKTKQEINAQNPDAVDRARAQSLSGFLGRHLAADDAKNAGITKQDRKITKSPDPGSVDADIEDLIKKSGEEAGKKAADITTAELKPKPSRKPKEPKV